MLQGETSVSGEMAWAAVAAAADWREVDAKLRRLARRRARLDHEEMEALREAMRVQVWREVGCASMREYLERVFGYGPRVASERLRVASALDAMPALDDALDTGELPYSAVREIARVATSRTASAWVDACRGKCLREIEDLVAAHTEGDLPDAPPREHTRPQLLRLELEGSDYALWRQARQIVEGERDAAVSDRELFAAACTALIECARAADLAHVGGDSTDATREGSDSIENAQEGPESIQNAHDSTGDAHVGRDVGALEAANAGSVPRGRAGTQRLGSDVQRGRAKYQIATIICEECKRGWQEGGGKRVPVSDADVERAECDAQRIGSLKGDPEAAVQDIPPKTRRFVWRRDGDRCTVPGCRASSFIEVHHIVHREHGGGHEPENLTLLCGGHHDAHHAGKLIIRGRAPDLTFELAGERLAPAKRYAHVGTPRAGSDDDAVRQTRSDAVLALTTLGYKKPEAVAAVDAALGSAGPPLDLEALLRLALQRVPSSRG